MPDDLESGSKQRGTYAAPRPRMLHNFTTSPAERNIRNCDEARRDATAQPKLGSTRRAVRTSQRADRCGPEVRSFPPRNGHPTRGYPKVQEIAIVSA
jgi:hypothetical protein